jgi:uncharacterized RDD family membrane protein YckC
VTAPASPDYAGVVSRSIAYVLDAAIVATACTGAAMVVGLIVSVIGRSDDLARAVGSVFVVGLPAMLAFYFAIFWGLAGRTIGMAVLGLRVVATGRRPHRWRSAVIRAAVLAYFPVGAAWMLVDRRHQAVHDKLARTAVVRTLSPATGR